MNLYADTNERRIVDDDGNTYTPEEAKQLIIQGGVEDFNLSLERLLRQFNGDWYALEQFYREADAQRQRSSRGGSTGAVPTGSHTGEGDE